MGSREVRRFLRVLALTALLASVSIAMANGDDGHQFPHIEQEDAMLYAQWFLDQFVDRGEIDERWRGLDVKMTAILLELATGPEWLVMAKAENETDTDGVATIYLYFGPMGQFLGWESKPAR